MDAPLALYRRYRPETFAEVLGQDHVTVPLRQALATNRVHHAYLFSGPRGCGKTTSARILARTLNCERFPTAEPCGGCRSCRDLARGGPGSLDVIEIDAASHGGVDDTRELRERATFAPMNSRFKVYVIDEAHMVSPQGFNALLKVVEEPPPHVKFIFATTEPDKVISTIRSRTHHYPFRLLPPRLLGDYLSQICAQEGVDIAAQALPLVVRAGGGSARDSLSVLDQLIGGAGPDGVTYDLATALLGYTPETLIDSVVDAFAAGDGAGVFTLVDQVVEGGREPRRFVEDLLQRLRDLLVLAHVPSAGERLLDTGPEQVERLAGQAARFGPADLVRAAEVVAATLADLRGPTAPRLLLEIMCARVLLPSAENTTQGVQARLDRLERRLTVGAVTTAQAAAAAPAASTAAAPAPAAPASAAPDPVAPASSVVARSEPAPTEPAPTEPAPTGPAPDGPAPPGPAEPAAASPAVQAPAAGGAAVGNELHQVRTLWPDVLEALKSSRYVWSLVTQQAQVVAAGPGTVTLGFRTPKNLENLRERDREATVTAALSQVLGGEWRLELVVDPSERAPGESGTPGAPPQPSVGDTAAHDSGSRKAAADSWRTPPPAAGGQGAETAAGTGSRSAPTRAPEPDDLDGGASADDLDVEPGASTHELLTRELGATVIEEVRHNR